MKFVGTDVEPHSFRTLFFTDIFPNGRCRHCYFPRSAHPIHAWVPARFLGDNRRFSLADAAIAALHPEGAEKKE